MELQRNAKECKGIQGNTQEYIGIQENTQEYKGNVQGSIRGNTQIIHRNTQEYIETLRNTQDYMLCMMFLQSALRWPAIALSNGLLLPDRVVQ